jgi:hypothetical protein
MTPGDLAPGFIRVAYHSAFGLHVMTIPVNTPNPDTGTPADSTIDNWSSGEVNWRTMTDDLIALIKAIYSTNSEFDSAQLFTKSVGAAPIPVDSYTLAVAGTETTPGWEKATQQTLSARDAGFNEAKLVFLDFASGNDFGKYTDATAVGLNLIFDEWSDPTNGWGSRKNARPATFIAATRTLNEKLRRAYRLT